MKQFFFLLFFFLTAGQIIAAENFSEQYDVSYVVAPDGKTTVTSKITLTNKTATLYPKQYAILLDTDEIKNIIASDRKGIITPLYEQKDGKTEIRLVPNEAIVGLGKQTILTLRYENAAVTKKLGTIWEVQIPAMQNIASDAQYRLTLDVPESFGINSYLVPKPKKERLWQTAELSRGGIAAAYGDKQRYDVNLRYQLANTSSEKANRTVAIPPDTAFQKTTIISIDPLPETIERTKEGNWLAHYTLSPKSQLTIQAAFFIEVTVEPRESFSSDVPDETAYRGATAQWQVGDRRIKNLAQTYNTPRKIYDYVVSALTYDYQRMSEPLNRRGALGALDNPNSALCTEFTDLFIAIARAAGIPARENVGFAYTTNPKLRPLSLINDVLHAWPEYYDSEKSLWIPVDPTWENTTGGVNYFDKLDFNHIVFAIHGVDSEQPLPAGFYREGEKSGKDVSVSFARERSGGEGKLAIDLLLPPFLFSGLPLLGSARITNTSGTSIDNVAISIAAKDIAYSQNVTLGQLTPLSTKTVPISADLPFWQKRGPLEIVATVNDELMRRYVPVYPLWWLIFFVFVIFSVMIGAVVAWKRRKRHRLSRR